MLPALWRSNRPPGMGVPQVHECFAPSVERVTTGTYLTSNTQCLLACANQHCSRHQALETSFYLERNAWVRQQNWWNYAYACCRKKSHRFPSVPRGMAIALRGDGASPRCQLSQPHLGPFMGESSGDPRRPNRDRRQMTGSMPPVGSDRSREGNAEGTPLAMSISPWA